MTELAIEYFNLEFQSKVILFQNFPQAAKWTSATTGHSLSSSLQVGGLLGPVL